MLSDAQRIFLANSTEFQRLIASDPYLNALSLADFDFPAERAALGELAGISARIGHLKIHPVTPVLWSFLWMTGNHYTSDISGITEEDTAVFLYLLCMEKTDFDPDHVSGLPKKALKWCARYRINYVTSASALIRVVQMTFRPLELLPDPVSKQDEAEPFNMDWLVHLGCIAALESGHTFEDVIQKKPLSFCFSCLIQHLRKHDPDNLIRKRMDGEISAKIVRYIDILGERFCGEMSQKTNTNEREKL